MDDPDYTPDGSSYALDFRVGGHERFSGLAPEGTPYSYDACTTTSCPTAGSYTATRCTARTTGCRCR
jgi:hypothetical protein